ncbi:hypothetical protein EZS27_028733 [termite gut metagenome]|uniref:Uncharacterized protein n=1 Tax=termite gut metagenome TaxID=433724 RepID=A0A5J4QL37_9ZZZZ
MVDSTTQCNCLFLDEELFKSREEILDFAETVLRLSISRASKRSRMEYIGWIVCEVTKLNDNQITELELVRKLQSIVAGQTHLK